MAEIRMLTGGSAPTPSTNEVSLYVKPDKRFYMKDDTGAEVKLLTDEAVINDLSVTLPLVKTGTTTPIISINTATTSLNGVMSALDKTKLDNATFLNTNTTLVMRNSQGDFNANQISANLFNGPSTTTVTIPALTGAIISDGTSNATTYSALSITNSHIAANAGIVLSKLAQDPLNRALHTGTQSATTIFDFDSTVLSSVNSYLDNAPITNFNISTLAGIELSKLEVDPLDRSLHTGTQLASSISNFNSKVLENSASVLNVNNNVALLITNRYVFVDTTSAEITISLPPATTAALFTIKKVLGGNNVVIDPDGTDTIEGATSSILTTQYEYITLVSNQIDMWMIVGIN